MMRFKDKVALVTGATGGMGECVFKLLGDEGAKLVISGRRYELLLELADDYKKKNPDCEITCVKADVSDKESVDALVNTVIDKYGRIDKFAHCSGVLTYDSLLDLSEEDFDYVIQVNLKGTFLMLQAVGAHMLKQKEGKICVISSRAGKRGLPNLSHYCASKFGINALVQSAALEWGRQGVYVNCVCPGEVWTPMLEDCYADIAEIQGISMEEQIKRGEDLPLIGRFTPPEKIAPAVAFLLSSDSDETIGHALNVDGGILFY